MKYESSEDLYRCCDHCLRDADDDCIDGEDGHFNPCPEPSCDAGKVACPTRPVIA